ncbi:MAG: sulfatase-like hydrolase/transferase, partial [Planctomycetota bacterium]
RMDRNIGRVLNTLRETDKLDNTAIFFLSDNGACPDSKDRSTVKGSMPWEVTSYLTQGKAWANASNTPYRYYKTTDYEGGIRTPMIACWPEKIPAGSMTDFPGHLIDFMPTFLELAGESEASELPGQSLVPVLQGEKVGDPRTLFWQFGTARAIRDGDWKAVQKGKEPWELYDLANDPVEVQDLSKSETQRLANLKSDWSSWWETKRIKPVLEKLP